MKPLLFAMMLLSVSATSFSQQSNSSRYMIDNGYLQKSKHQKTAAWILLATGGTLVTTGFIIPKGELIHESFLQKTYKNDGIKSTLVFGGIAAITGSLTLFFLASKNKQKAMSLSIKNEQVSLIQKNSLVYDTIPSISLKINL